MKEINVTVQYLYEMKPYIEKLSKENNISAKETIRHVLLNDIPLNKFDTIETSLSSLEVVSPEYIEISIPIEKYEEIKNGKYYKEYGIEEEINALIWNNLLKDFNY